MSYTCKECGFNLWLPIIGDKDSRLGFSHVGLYNDGRFPGRCLVVLDIHEEEIIHLDDDILRAFMRDVKMVGQAIQDTLNPDRINYAILGNAVPHIHCHVIPRYHNKDPYPKSTPWSRNDKAWQMDKERYEKIIEGIRKRLI